MKKLFKSVFALAIMGLALVSCNKADEAIPQDPEKGYVYTFSVVDDYAPTKATLGTNGVGWESGDRVGLFTPNSHGYASIDVSKTPKEVILYSKEIIPAGSKAYAYYPYSSDNTKDDDEAAKIVFLDVQQGTSVSAMPMAGIPFTVETEVAAKTNQNGVIKFLNLGSIIEFNVFSSKAEYQTETVKSILVKTTGDDYVSGNTYLDLTQVDASDESSLSVIFIQASDAKNEVKVNQDAQVADSKNNATPVYMVLVPGNHSGLIIVNTDLASYTWNLPSVAFKRNGLKHFNMDLNNATRGPLNEVVKTLPYEEPFTASIGEFTTNEVIPVPEIGAIWKWGGATYGMKATASTGGKSPVNYASEAWLISPWIDLTGGVQYAAVTFDHVHRYAGTATEELTFWVLSDDIGAKWTQHTIPTYASGTNWTFVNSEEISLNSYVGKKVKVGFKYLSNTTNAATWEIKNFKAFVASAPKTANPVISYEASTKTVTITCETPGAKIGYTTDGTNPDADDSGPKGTTQLYTGPFTISKTTTVKAFAGADEMDPSDIVSKECVVGYEFETIAQLNALATTTSKSVYGKLTNAVVSFVPGTMDAVIKDATGSVLYHKKDHGLKQGQYYTGDITVDLIYYNGLYSDITSIDVKFEGDGEVVNPEVLTLTQLTGNYTKYQNTYAKIENIKVTNVSGKNITVSDGTNTYVVYTNYGDATCAVEDKITAIGTITKYGTTEELKVWSADDITVTEHTAAEHAINITQSTGGTITAKVDGNEIASGTKVMEGKTVQLSVTIDNNYNFNQWIVEGAVNLSSTTSHVVTFKVGTEDVSVSATFTNQSGTTYTKVTTAPTDWSGTYIIVYESSATSGLVCLAGTDAYQNFTTATIASGVISSNDLSSYEVQIASYDTGYSIKALGGANANKYLEGKGDSNGTKFNASPSKVTTFSLSGGLVTITNNTDLFVYNSTNGQNGERWRFYKSGTAGSGGVYKKPALYRKN